jgi:ribosomal-protein-alanine N-acetyltransferase
VKAVRIQPLRREDLARCAELELVLFHSDDPWSEAALRSELDFGNYYLGAYVDGVGLVGYVGISLAGDAGGTEASVHTIGVDPAWQGKGVGKALLGAALARADQAGAPVFLEVRTDNATAIGLYESHGFRRTGLRRRYYQQSGADAYTMMRPRRAAGEEPA